MAKKNEPVRPRQDALASEIDALLKKLPGADPDLIGGGGAPARSAAASAPRPAAAPLARPQTRPAGGGPPSDGRTTLAVWGRVALGVLLGVGLTQWPYRDDCGWRLLGYGAAVSVMLLVAGWCAITTWRHRTGVAHAVSLVMGFWGIVLAAEILLPRIGYAAEDATWRCPAPTVVPAPRRGPSALPPAVQQPPSTDDATAQPAEATEPAPGETPTPPDSTGG